MIYKIIYLLLGIQSVFAGDPESAVDPATGLSIPVGSSTVTGSSDNVIKIEPVKFAQGTGIEGIMTVVGLVINMLLFFAGTSAIIYFIYSGILYITSAGNPDNVKKGQQGMVNAVIGIVIVVLSYYIVTAVRDYANIIPTK